MRARESYRDDPVRQVASCDDLDELKVLLDDRSGYIREAAVGRVVALCCAGAIPAVMPRLNDFVPQVREAARRAVQTLLPFAGQDDLLACLGYTWRLRHFSRVDHSAWIADAQAELAGRLSTQQLCEALVSNDPLIARGSFMMLLESELLPRDELLARAIQSSRDILMARQAAQLALSLAGDGRVDALQLGLRSRFGAVRTLALRGLLDCVPDGTAIARSALLDRQRSARSLAQHYLRKQGWDVAGYYRALFEAKDASNGVICIALEALSRIGSIDDLSLVLDKARSESSLVRGAVYQAWLKLVPAAKDDIALAALCDVSLANRKLSAIMAVRHGAFVPFERVQEILDGKPGRTVLLSFARLRKWDWLETLAREGLRAERGSPEWEALAEELQRWLTHAGQSYERPARAQRGRILAPEIAAVLEQLCIWRGDILRYELELIAAN